MTACTLTDMVSWFACAQSVFPAGEVITLLVFIVFMSILKQDDNFRGALVASSLLATITAFGFYAMGQISPVLAIGGAVLTALSAVFLKSQNSPG